MRTRWTALVASLAALLLAIEPNVALPSSRTPSSHAMAHAAEVAAPVLRRDADVQTKIAAVARATSEADATAALAALRASVLPDFSDLVPQLALFLLDADGERAGMTPALIVSRLGITRAQILRAVAPHLETPDAKLRAQLENLLGAVELDDVRAFVAAGSTPPPDGLVRYLYVRSPAEALAVLAPASGGAARASSAGEDAQPVAEVEDARAALAAGRATAQQTARAAATLGALSHDPDWRLRAYAAAVLRAEAALAAVDSDALSRAQNDPDSRVRAVAMAPRPR